MGRSVFLLLTMLPFAAQASGEGPPGPPAPFVPSGSVEVGGNYHSVTNGFGDWSGEYISGEYQADPQNHWHGEFENQREFGSTGIYGGIANTHIFNEDWFSDLAISAGSGSNILPHHREDALISRKWLSERELVTTVGVGSANSPSGYSDKSIYFGATYYVPQLPWVLQAGYRYNLSSPGDVDSSAQFVAVTEGRDKEHLITLRYGFGSEAYQLIGADQAISDFDSNQISLQWKQWLGEDWGFDTRAEHYRNPNYERTGIVFGVFKEF